MTALLLPALHHVIHPYVLAGNCTNRTNVHALLSVKSDVCEHQSSRRQASERSSGSYSSGALTGSPLQTISPPRTHAESRQRTRRKGCFCTSGNSS